MGYPVVTRLGVNQFWYRHWYTDTTYKQNCHQDLIFERFIMLYVTYGTAFKNNIFFHEYWYTKSSKSVRTTFSNSYLKNFRRHYYAPSDSISEIKSFTLVRNHSGEYFPMRCWILKYNNWVILSLKLFKPLKMKRYITSMNSRRVSMTAVATNLNYKINNNIRFKLFYSYMFKHFKSIDNIYSF